MNRLEHLSDQGIGFVEEYLITGNATKFSTFADYKNSPSLSNQASRLKKELAQEINLEIILKP